MRIQQKACNEESVTAGAMHLIRPYRQISANFCHALPIILVSIFSAVYAAASVSEKKKVLFRNKSSAIAGKRRHSQKSPTPRIFLTEDRREIVKISECALVYKHL